MHVAFIYNIATEELLRERPEETMKDCDADYTIEAVTKALEAGGHRVTGLNADQQLPAVLAERRTEFDVVFNIATGVYGKSPQSHVPALCEYLRIPHTGSSVLAEAICESKPVTKRLLTTHGILTPAFQLFQSASDPLDPTLHFPLIVKLPEEGASMGLTYDSVVDDEAALRKQVALMIDRYQEGAIVEEYIEGREFTVVVLGHSPAYTLPIAELHFFGQKRIRLDEPDAPMFDDFKRISGQPDITYLPMESESRAPADLDEATADRVRQAAIRAFQAVDCLDWARIDLRMNERGEVYVLEINLEPGIAPDYVMAKCAFAAGWSFDQMINRILDHAIERYSHLKVNRR